MQYRFAGCVRSIGKVRGSSNVSRRMNEFVDLCFQGNGVSIVDIISRGRTNNRNNKITVGLSNMLENT